MKRIIQSIILTLFSLTTSNSHANIIPLEEALKRSGTVLFIRHALAPGFGDPSHFDVSLCETQRNLNTKGKKQAKAIGSAFRLAGYSGEPVLTSPWCRCRETAVLMNIGPVEKFSGLSSFFENHVERSTTLSQLKKRISQILPSSTPIVMVTHQVVISAITGIAPISGGAVLYDPRKRNATPVSIAAQ